MLLISIVIAYVLLCVLVEPLELVVLQRIFGWQCCLVALQLAPADVRLEAELVRNILNHALHSIVADGKVVAHLIAIPAASLLVSIVVQQVFEFVQVAGQICAASRS